MKKILRVEVEIEISNLPPAARKEAAICEGTVVEELPKMSDATLTDLRPIIEACIQGNDEAFGGSMVYAAFTKATVTNINWKRERARLAR